MRGIVHEPQVNIGADQKFSPVDVLKQKKGGGGRNCSFQEGRGIFWGELCFLGKRGGLGGGAVDPYFITVERDESRIVFVAKLSRRRWQSTCPSPSLRIEMCLG